jgi:hypothetical protein
MKPLIFISSVFGLMSGTAALSQNCISSGSSIFCDSGLTGFRTGNNIVWSDRASITPAKNSDFLSAGRSGDTTQTNSSNQSENSPLFVDGQKCTRSANALSCN